MESGNILAIPPSGDHPLSESSGDGNVWPVGHVNHELPPVRQVSESFALGDVAQPQPLPTEKLAAREPIDAEELRKAYWAIEGILRDPNVVRSFCEASPDGTGMPCEVEAVLQKYPEAFQAELLDFKPYDNEPSLRKTFVRLKLEYTYKVIKGILKDPNVVKSFCEASPDGTGMPCEVEAVLQKCSQEFQDEFLDFKPRRYTPSLRERLGRLKLEYTYNVIDDILRDPNVVKSFCEASPDGTGMPREVKAVLQKYPETFQTELLDFKLWRYNSSLRERLGRLKLEYTRKVINEVFRRFCPRTYPARGFNGGTYNGEEVCKEIMEEVRKYQGLEGLLTFRPTYPHIKGLTVEEMLKIATHFPILVKASEALFHSDCNIDGVNAFYKLMSEIDPDEVDIILHLYLGDTGPSDSLQNALKNRIRRGYRELYQYLRAADSQSPIKCLGEFYAKMDKFCENAKRAIFAVSNGSLQEKLDEVKSKAVIHLISQLTQSGLSPRFRLLEFCRAVMNFGAKNTETLPALLAGPNGETLQRALNEALKEGSDLLRRSLAFNGKSLTARSALSTLIRLYLVDAEMPYGQNEGLGIVWKELLSANDGALQSDVNARKKLFRSELSSEEDTEADLIKVCPPFLRKELFPEDMVRQWKKEKKMRKEA
jgi:hypothetical protein